ncbi:rhodanese-like domain-containing protein [Azospirillum sp. TSO22-1]|uniref:rhodanese-like domain-containing protein n=1 Tax=Azospirillum sp. TSO22-1 TaxID=716789 RepID=UPI000D619063|nr:rhodanese-like domain-containing protein [Azospirillum sp. TSO22-1]PWC44941.1 sulfurtransferase [Azospirillum sp. TSO22-1]
MSATATPAQVRQALIDGREIALLDAREEGPYSRAHPLFAVSMPLSRLELTILDLVPRRSAPVVVYDDGEGDDGEGLAERAATRLRALGYGDVAVLAGGLSGWIAAGGEVYRDVNVPSKAFGELVEHHRRTPSLAAEAVKALIESDKDVVVLDARRFEEYRTMAIPGGVSVPGAELVYRIFDIAPSPATTVIVNCAGRTRSIIGTQSLVNAGIPNPVAALRNGTIGWTLAGLALETGQERRFPPVSPEGRARAQAAARSVAERAGAGRVDRATLAAWRADEERTLYLFDVRTPEEYEAGHLPGFRHAAGGQLVQATDEYVGVRGARIVLADDDGVRADMTASWLAQMGWDVHVLDGGVGADGLEAGPRARALPPFPDGPVNEVEPLDLLGPLDAGEAVVVDLAPSPKHAAGHVPGAWFAVRAELGEALKRLPDGVRPVLTSPCGVLARYAAADLTALAGVTPALLKGGTTGWRKAGLPLESGLPRALSEPDDVYKRPYEGTDNTAAAMQGYIDWELELVAQLERDGTHRFRVL